MCRSLLLLLALIVVAACDSARGRDANMADESTLIAPGSSELGLDPLVGRWRLDRSSSSAGGDPPRPPEEVLGDTLILQRDGGLLVVGSPRRGTWRRTSEGVRILLDPPPTTLDALFTCSVSDLQMRLDGPTDWHFVYRRDTILAPAREPDEAPPSP